jgi:hypothetical protein
LYGVRFQNDNDGPLLAKIRLNAINGYYFEWQGFLYVRYKSLYCLGCW